MARQAPIFAPMKARGMALLMVVISLALISAVVTDLLVEQTSSYQIALRQRDALKAEALAESGLNVSQLFLIIQGPIQNFFTLVAGEGVSLPKQTVWEMLPMDSDLLSGLASGELATTLGVDVSEAVKKRKEEEKKKLAEKIKEREKKTHSTEGLFVSPEGGFGSFEGSFKVEVTDEESKISFRNWTTVTAATERIKTRKLLAGLMASSQYDALFKKVTRADLIANIYDYLDIDQVRINPNAIGEDWGSPYGGSESELYLDARGVLPKNAYFDSLGELNLVSGFTDKHFEAFANALTIYGEGPKINILSAKEPVIEPLMRYCAKNDLDPLLMQPKWVDAAVKGWMQYKTGGGGAVSPAGFASFLSSLSLSVNQKECQDILGVESKNFSLKSQATVNGVSRTLTLVARVVEGQQERYYFKGQ